MHQRKPSISLDGLEEIDAVLRESRPRLPEDRVRRVAARARAAAISNPVSTVHRKDSSMRSRLAIMLMLVFGFALSGTGAGLAISGVSGNAAQSSQGEYPHVSPNQNLSPQTPQQQVAGEHHTGNGNGTAPRNEVSPAETSPTQTSPTTTTTTTNGVQATRQLGADVNQGGQLPFTGFAAIPVLLVGLALLGGGLLLHRGSRQGS